MEPRAASLSRLAKDIIVHPAAALSSSDGTLPLRRSRQILGAVLLCCFLVCCFVPILGPLRLADASWRVLSLAAFCWGCLAAGLFSGPVLLHAVARRLGGQGDARAGSSAAYVAVSLGLAAQVLSLIVLRMLARWLGYFGPALAALAALAAACWVLRLCYLQLRTSHALPASATLASLAAVFLAGSAWAGLVGAGAWRAIAAERARAEAAMRDVSWPAARQPGGGGENATIYYKRAAALAVPMTEAQRGAAPEILRGGWRDPDGQWARLLEKNRDALDLVRQAAHTEFCDFTEGRLEVLRADTPVPEHEFELELSRLLLLDARSLEARGRTGEAMEDYAAVLLVAGHMAQQRNFMQAHQAVYREILAMAWEPLSQFAQSGLGSASDYQRLLDVLSHLKAAQSPPGELARDNGKMAAAYRAATLSAIGRELRSGLRERAAEQGGELSAQAVEQAAVAADQNEPEIYARYLDGLRKDNPEIFHAGLAYCVSHPEVFGRCWTLVNLAVEPDPGRDIVLYHVAAAKLDLLAAGAALRLYEKGHGGEPAGLAALVPEYLAAIPEDPFDGFKPLRYSLSPQGSWTLYSLGPDRKDDKGQLAFAADDIPDWRNPPPGDLILSGEGSAGTRKH